MLVARLIAEDLDQDIAAFVELRVGECHRGE
jgi:hypothetical protein